MDEQYYPFELLTKEQRYEFVSVSARKQVRKVVLLTETDVFEVRNLALLDLIENGTLSDVSETRNQDMQKVLATVIRIINHYLEFRPNIIIVFRGSDDRRQRLYSMVLSRELEKIEERFLVWGVADDNVEKFTKNRHYSYYLIERKHERDEGKP